jgi:hypothetical protein
MITCPIRVAPYGNYNARLLPLLGWDVLQHFEVLTNWSARVVTLIELTPP